jgi:hypothetical protein
LRKGILGIGVLVDEDGLPLLLLLVLVCTEVNEIVDGVVVVINEC